MESRQQPPIRAIPHACRMIFTRSNNALSVRRKQGRINGSHMSLESSKQTAIRAIPYPCRMVFARSHHALAVG